MYRTFSSLQEVLLDGVDGTLNVTHRIGILSDLGKSATASDKSHEDLSVWQFKSKVCEGPVRLAAKKAWVVVTVCE